MKGYGMNYINVGNQFVSIRMQDEEILYLGYEEFADMDVRQMKMREESEYEIEDYYPTHNRRVIY